MIMPMEELYIKVIEASEKNTEYSVKKLKLADEGLCVFRSLSITFKEERTEEFVHITITRWNEPEENHPEQKPYRSVDVIYGTLNEKKPKMAGTYRIRMKGTDRGVKGSIYESVYRSKGWDWKEIDVNSPSVTMLVRRIVSLLDPINKVE